MIRSELTPVLDERKSFYGKAKVEMNGDKKVLVSYVTEVAEIEEGQLKVFGTYSATTIRHIREFAYQNGFGCLTKKQIENYIV